MIGSRTVSRRRCVVVVMPRVAAKLPIASTFCEPNLDITDGDWLRIEQVYGHQLSAEIRRQILEATTSFVYCEVFDRSAEPRSWAAKRIDRVRKAAGQFYKALLEGPQTGARFYADYLIRQYLKDPRLADGNQLEHLHGVLTSLLVACNLAAGEINDPNSKRHREGERWNSWIRQLTTIVEGHGLPSGARSDSDKLAGDESSPFVAFVDELQNRAPADARRHSASKFALAKAIQRAREAKRRDTNG
jgi:hypothetical protein